MQVVTALQAQHENIKIMVHVAYKFLDYSHFSLSFLKLINFFLGIFHPLKFKKRKTFKKKKKLEHLEWVGGTERKTKLSESLKLFKNKK